MRTRAGSSGSNRRLARVNVSCSVKYMDDAADDGGASDRAKGKDGRGQRWSRADNLRADAPVHEMAGHGPGQWARAVGSSRVSRGGRPEHFAVFHSILTLPA